MKNFIFMLVLLTISVQAADLKWYSYNEALKIAESENKYIMIDFYTDWCTWCKKMDSDVFQDDDISKKLKENFVLVKLNPEKSGELQYKNQTYTNQQFAAACGVRGFPAIAFFDINENFIDIIPGYRDSDAFMDVLNFIESEEFLKYPYQVFEIKTQLSQKLKKDKTNPEINFVLGFLLLDFATDLDEIERNLEYASKSESLSDEVSVAEYFFMKRKGIEVPKDHFSEKMAAKNEEELKIFVHEKIRDLIQKHLQT
ncbi:MAG: thioredoxin fold domain-containing protein [Melioribacteraceae bacterium]|nr:thioredoxin fold domain-containing protein [Melioribacteraceae bacterium]MCF8265364.1 thioredoxin fold domain-containing protein [Melioribacteraceae bacterium]MCF8412142.1 thioredoxin fold domain-containing protein [Melioribacteraceae bacterium]